MAPSRAERRGRRRFRSPPSPPLINSGRPQAGGAQWWWTPRRRRPRRCCSCGSPVLCYRRTSRRSGGHHRDGQGAGWWFRGRDARGCSLRRGASRITGRGAAGGMPQMTVRAAEQGRGEQQGRRSHQVIDTHKRPVGTSFPVRRELGQLASPQSDHLLRAGQLMGAARAPHVLSRCHRPGKVGDCGDPAL
jgi:hypothetical protein